MPDARKETEDKLKIFSDAVDNADEAIILSGINLTINYANKSALNKLGYTKDEITKLKIKDIDSDPDSFKNMDAEMEKQGRWSGERFVITKNKKEIPVMLSVSFIKDEKGSISGIMGSFADITNRKETEELLKKETAFTENTLNTMEDVFYAFDLNGKFIRWNKRMLKVLGYTNEEISSMKPTDFFKGEDKNKIATAIDAAIKEGHSRVEALFFAKDGKDIPYEFTGSKLLDYDGKLLGVVGTGRDISERIKHQKQLETIMDSVPAWIVYKDKENRFVRVNKSYANVVGVPKEKLEGTSCFDLYSKEAAEVYWKDDKEVIESGKPKIGIIESAQIRNDLRWLRTDKIPYYDDDGKIIGIVAFAIDITEQKEAEEAIAKSALINSALADLSKKLLVRNSIEEISYLMLEKAKELTGSRFGYVGYIDEKTGALVAPMLTRDIWDKCDVPDKNIVFHKFSGLFGWVLNNKKTLMTNATSLDPRSSGTPNGHIPIERFLSAPAIAGDKLVGQIALANSDRDYNAKDIILIEQIAAIYAIAVSNNFADIALRESEEKYRDILDNAADLIQSVTPDGKFLYVNNAWKKALEYNDEEASKINLADIIHPDYKDYYMENFKKLMSGKKLGNIELAFLTKDGKKIFVEGTSTCKFEEGKPVSTRAIFRDVTEKKELFKQLETRLSELEKFHKFTIDREMRLVELKKRVRELEKKLGIEN